VKIHKPKEHGSLCTYNQMASQTCFKLTMKSHNPYLISNGNYIERLKFLGFSNGSFEFFLIKRILTLQAYNSHTQALMEKILIEKL
jgi:hypothetical protein